MLGSVLGRPKKNGGMDKKTEYTYNIDRIVVERLFALAKHKYGLGLITRSGSDNKKFHSAFGNCNGCGSDMAIPFMHVFRYCLNKIQTV